MFQQHHTQSWRQSQRHDARHNHRNRDGDRKLAVQFTRQATEKANRNKHGRQHQHNRNHRASYFLHGLDRGFAGTQALFMHDSLNVFQHHNGVVHHNTNGQHHAEQGQCVNGIAQQVQTSKRTQQGHGYSQNRNQRGAPVLQKHIHHDEHQNHRFNQCFYHFANRDFHKTCGVIRHRIV